MRLETVVTRHLLFAAAATALAAVPFQAEAAATAATATNSSNSTISITAPPSGFDDLAQPREILVDVYFGSRKVGSAIAVSRPGFIQFRDPQRVASLIPNLASTADLSDALAGDLQSHADRVCGQTNRSNCGSLEPQSLGIIFDEGRFRVDIFVPAAMLRTIALSDKAFLDPPAAMPSLTSMIGLAVAGSRGQPVTYNVQNRTIAAIGPGRVTTDLSYSSGLGVLVDDLVGEIDRHDLRYSGGLFWAPGADLTGRRRIVGVGLGTQFDTRTDREGIAGTPLVLFLSQPARVEFLIDGRLVGSRAYDAGNNILDTSSLPDGSYPLVLRINGADGTEREERRFYVKMPQVAPVGHPLFFAYAGMLANSRPDRLVSISDTFYYQAGVARRLSQQLALDVSVVGTQDKAMTELGGWLLTPFADVRAAGLVSTAGDAAALVQASSNARGPFNFAFDLRRVWSSDGRPLIPLPDFVDSFGGGGAPAGAGLGGSYLQASGTVGYRLGAAYLSIVGSLRKEDGRKSSYSIGPSFTWPVLSLRGLQLTVQADGQRSNIATSVFGGVRLIYTSNHLSVAGSAGYATTDSRGSSGPSKSRAVGGLSANYVYEDQYRTQLSAGAGIERSMDSTVGHAGGTAYTRYGNARVDVLDSLEGPGSLQYGVSVQTALAVAGGKIGLGARDLDDSALLVEVDGEAPGSRFKVLVNNRPYGEVEAGGLLPVHLTPYRAYEVRVLPVGAAAIALDSDSRTVTLYPGSARLLRWHARRYFTAFGQAVSSDGRPIVNAMVKAPHSVGETDENGYFQVDTANGEVLTFTRDTSSCAVTLERVSARNDFVSLGKTVCK